MSSTQNPIRLLAIQLKEFTTQVAVVWEAYQSCGPGKVESELFDNVETVAKSLGGLLENVELNRIVCDLVNIQPDELSGHIEALRDLCYRCACTPQGLCFITGEAGLIPRKDQHETFEQFLSLLREQLRILEKRTA